MNRSINIEVFSCTIVCVCLLVVFVFFCRLGYLLCLKNKKESDTSLATKHTTFRSGEEQIANL